MHRTEAQFCQDEAIRLLELAMECIDQGVVRKLTEMAKEWAERAELKESLAEVAAARAQEIKKDPTPTRH